MRDITEDEAFALLPIANKLPYYVTCAEDDLLSLGVIILFTILFSMPCIMR